MTLPRYGQHTLDLSGMGRLLVGGIVEEGADCRQTQIAASGGNPAALFEIIQKSSDHWCINSFEIQTGRRLSMSKFGSNSQLGSPIFSGGGTTRFRYRGISGNFDSTNW